MNTELSTFLNKNVRSIILEYVDKSLPFIDELSNVIRGQHRCFRCTRRTDNQKLSINCDICYVDICFECRDYTNVYRCCHKCNCRSIVCGQCDLSYRCPECNY